MSDKEKMGIIGAGNMGEAIAAGLQEDAEQLIDLIVFDIDNVKLEEVAVNYNLETADSLEALVVNSDYLLFAVKPDIVEQVAKQVTEYIEGWPEAEKINGVISIAAGVRTKYLRRFLPEEVGIVRVMPNTPLRVGEGISFLAMESEDRRPELLNLAKEIFSAVGRVEVVAEDKMNAVTALSGSGPAYVFYFLEALKEAGVYLGLEAETAEVAALQTLMGAGKLAEESEEDFYALRAAVSSPGGTTVEALKHLEENGLKGKLQEAVKKAASRAGELEQQ